MQVQVEIATVCRLEDLLKKQSSFCANDKVIRVPVEMTSVKLAAYSHSAADSPKKVRVQKHPQKR